MVKVSRATKADLPAIRHLSAKYGNKMVVEEYHINNRDIALQARLDDGTLAGFVWLGLMGNNKIGYVDKVMVNPDHSDKGILPALYKELFKKVIKLGVVTLFGVIKHDQYHDKSAKAALHMAFGADSKPYTYVFSNVNRMIKELGNG